MALWWLGEDPDNQMTFKELAELVSNGTIQESDTVWTDSGQEQVYNIPGIHNAVSKLQSSARDHHQRLRQTATEDTIKTSGPRHPKTSLIECVIGLRLPAVAAGLGCLTLAGWLLYHSSSQSRRFPERIDGPVVYHLPMVGRVEPVDFLLVEGNLLLAFAFFLLLSILFRNSSRR